MKPCTGCKHLTHITDGYAVCKWLPPDHQYKWETSPYTGRSAYVPEKRPSVEKMRSMDGECGPDAKLWEPNLWGRFWAWITPTKER